MVQCYGESCINPGDTFRPKMVFSDFALFINLFRYWEPGFQDRVQRLQLWTDKGGNPFYLWELCLWGPWKLEEIYLANLTTGCSVNTEANCSLCIILHILVVFRRMLSSYFRDFRMSCDTWADGKMEWKRKINVSLLFFSVAVFRAFFSPFPRFKVA